MMCNKDIIEKMVPSTEEEEKEKVNTVEERKEEEEEKEEGEKEAGDDCDDDHDEGENDGDNNDDDEEEGNDDEEAREEVMPQATDKKNPSPVKSEEKKSSDVLNLNNEVVKMRKEVKRVRALIIRKLTRQIAALKKKKGKEAEIERNQRRAARLLEEVHAIKNLLPDLVTKAALQKKLNFEEVCKNPKSTISDRAVARIATHTQFNKKIEDIKAAVKAFKEERMKGGKQGRQEKVQNQLPKPTLQSPDKRGERANENKEEDDALEITETIDSEEGGGVLKDTEVATVAEAEKELDKKQDSAGTADVENQEMPEFKSVRPEAVKSSKVKDTVKNKPQSKATEKKPNIKPVPAVVQTRTDNDESDFESSDDEEKEYFDDSTEERFHKQSSQSEESDDDDDFFVGKVSKFKKKKKQKNIDREEKADKRSEVEKDSVDNVKSKDKLQTELDELESRLKSKAPSMQSVFCSSLAGAKAGRGGGTGRGRGGDKFRGRGKPKGGSGLNRDFSKQSTFQKQEKGAENNSGSKYSKPCPEDRQPESEANRFASAGRGRGRGRGDAFRQKSHRGGGVFAHQPPQQVLHPSWEASKKRKEQQGQILAFQGKKIKFDDDD